MSKYIICILVVSIIGGIASSLMTGKIESIKKHINFIVGLISVIALITPVIKLASSASVIKNQISQLTESILDSDNITHSNSLIISTSLEKMSDSIKLSVSKRFNLKEDDIQIDFEIDKSNIEAIEILKINVVLSGDGSWSNTEKIKDYIEGLVGITTTVKRS